MEHSTSKAKEEWKLEKIHLNSLTGVNSSTKKALNVKGLVAKRDEVRTRFYAHRNGHGNRQTGANLNQLKKINSDLNLAIADYNQKASIKITVQNVNDFTSAFWSDGRYDVKLIDSYCKWQSHLYEKHLLANDIRLVFEHSMKDKVFLSEALQHESRLYAREIIANYISVYDKRIDLIKRSTNCYAS